MKKIVIIGASGHGKVVADIALNNGYEEIVFLDDNDKITDCGDYPVVGKFSQCEEYDCEFIVAIGNSKVRQRMQSELETAGKAIATLIHTSAVVGKNVIIGQGTVVMAGAVINPDTTIGKGCIINTCSSVDHDNRIEDYVHVSVGSHLAGTVTVGQHTWIGIGAVVNNNLEICADCMIGAGTVVVKNIEESGTYVGVPGKKIVFGE